VKKREFIEVGTELGIFEKELDIMEGRKCL